MAEQTNASLNPGREIWGYMESTTSKGCFLGALVFLWDRYSKHSSYPALCSLPQHGSIMTWGVSHSQTREGTDSFKDRPQLVWVILARGPQTHT